MKAKILRDFKSGKSISEMKKYYSTKTIYKYLRLHLIIEIRDHLQFIIDTDGFDTLNVPELKRIKEETKLW